MAAETKTKAEKAEKEVKETKEEAAIREGKDKALKMALDKIEKDFGKGSIMRLGDKSSVNVDCIPTGALALDIALGVGGVPRGRVIEIYGPESSGKIGRAHV